MGNFYRTLFAALLSGIAFAPTASGQILSFQQGVNGYTGTVDVEFRSADSTLGTSTAGSLSIDQDDGSSADQDNRTQGAIRFENIFGEDPGLIPLGEDILFAEIVFWNLSATAADAVITLDRVLGADQGSSGTAENLGVSPGDPTISSVAPPLNRAWEDTDTWFNLGGSTIPLLGADGFIDLPFDPIEVGTSDTLGVGNESIAAQVDGTDGVLPESANTTTNDFVSIEVTDSIIAFQNGAPNLGWSINNSTGDGWDIVSSDFSFSNATEATGVAIGAGDLAAITAAVGEDFELVRPLLRVVVGASGDIDLDGDIDAVDFDLLRFSLGNETSANGVEGDLDFDSDVDLDDFALFREAFTEANGAAAFAALVSGVPEPGSAVLCGFVALGFAGRRPARR